MAKWFAAGAVALLILLLIMWRQVGETSAKPKAEGAARDPVAQAPVRSAPKPIDVTKDVELPPPTPVPMTPDGKKIMNVQSEEFYRHFVDIIPKRLWKDAAICYDGKTGSRHRNSKVKYEFDVVVKNGKATIQNVRLGKDEDTGAVANTINDPVIESCFFSHVSRYAWDANEDMPDGYAMPDYTYSDSLLIRPERSKKYYKDNMDYVGEEAPPIALQRGSR
jgi:hypothetical protein